MNEKEENENENEIEEKDDDEENDQAIKPLHVMQEGDNHAVTGGSGNYEIRLRGGVYYCTCTAWKMQNKSVDKRTCKHLRDYLGDEFETNRVGEEGNAPAKTQKVQAPSLLLAQKYEKSTIDPKGWWMSEKLDGVRAFWDGKKFISR